MGGEANHVTNREGHITMIHVGVVPLRVFSMGDGVMSLLSVVRNEFVVRCSRWNGDSEEQIQSLAFLARTHLTLSRMKSNLRCCIGIRARGFTKSTQNMGGNTSQDLSTIIQAFEDRITHLEDALCSIFNNNSAASQHQLRLEAISIVHPHGY